MRDFVAEVEKRLRPLADADRARPMAAYLRNHFAFLGLQAPVRRQAVKDLIRVRLESAAELVSIAQGLWLLPEREFRYVAIDLLAQQRRLLTRQQLPLLQALLLREPWWDTVDGLSGVIGKLLYTAARTDTDALRATDAWIGHASFWVRRSAVLHQLGWRLATDTDRLSQRALQLAGEQEFFIRKAVGWALRDYARWDPDWVRGFIAAHGVQLSALTLKEAAKHLRQLQDDSDGKAGTGQ